MAAWRAAGYPGVSSITKRLLDHWRDSEEFDGRRFFFCQLEAVETLIWLTEAAAAERVGIEVQTTVDHHAQHVAGGAACMGGDSAGEQFFPRSNNMTSQGETL